MNTLPRLATTLGLLLAGLPALANPGIAPGLWEQRLSMQGGDPRLTQKLEQAQRAMANLSPEQRKMMEQMMAQHGVSVGMGAGAGGPGMTLQVCITPEQAAKQELPPPGDRCTHRITGRTANSLKFAVECPAEQARGEGETVFSGNKAYEGRFRMERSQGGSTEKMAMQVNGRWLGADCGAIKPLK
jgi:Protein of unknown function (DUF3617)